MNQLDTTYDPQSVEPIINESWLNSDAFRPDKVAGDAYCIVIPPPNVTGNLHMGHAFTFTIQDMLIRQQRMQGKSVLWQPGTDHAGIATQMVVERLLDKEGVHRRDLGREAFLERVWQWKEQSGGTIVAQLKRMGASCDWSRERFTLDEGLSDAVREVFVQLYDEGLIYRGKRLVNWDPVLETAVSDLEVEHEEEDGHFWHICYPIAENPDQHVIIATTRPETMLGDAAVAVHPDDGRYQHLIGQSLILPLTGRTIPVISDTYVDPEFGTGCVKITPAHDFNDYDVGKRHDLPLMNIFTNQAHIVDDPAIPSQYHGMDRYEAREHIIADLDAAGLLHKVESHCHKIGRGDRSHAVIEPYLTDQWYVDIKPMAQTAIEAVENGDIRFVPEHWDKTYFEWMRNIQDWCISRQLWWGHRIPAWYCDDCNHITVAKTTPDSCGGCGSSGIHQDDDVLDTWFSSGLWPFSTLGWPKKTSELAKFYPTQVLVTGFDIIFFWVARMIMMGLKFTGQVPFKDIYIHALIRDAEGQKMSKSKGNVIDPLAIIDVYGADALRFTLAHMATPGRDIKLDTKRIESNRNFMNKIWNAARFVFMNRGDAAPDVHCKPTLEINRWIIGAFNDCMARVETDLAAYRFHEVATALYGFIWGHYCDWYVEAAKVSLYGDDEANKVETQVVMLTVLDGWLRLLHPVCPFITETLFRQLHGQDAMLVTASWPTPIRTEQAAPRMALLMDIVSAIRSIRGEMNVSPAKKVTASIAASDEVCVYLQTQEKLLKNLARIETLTWLPADSQVEGAAVAPLHECTVWLPLAGLVNVAEERARIHKNLARLQKTADKLHAKLSNARFLQNAPDAIVSKVREELMQCNNQKAELEAAVQRLPE